MKKRRREQSDLLGLEALGNGIKSLISSGERMGKVTAAQLSDMTIQVLTTRAGVWLQRLDPFGGVQVISLTWDELGCLIRDHGKTVAQRLVQKAIKKVYKKGVKSP